MFCLLLLAVLPIAIASSPTVRADSLGLGIRTVSPGVATTAQLTLDGVVSQPILGYSLGLEIPSPLGFSAYAPFNSGDQEFLGIQLGTEFVGIGVVFSAAPPTVVTRGPGFLVLGTLEVLVPALTAGESIEIPIVDGQGSPPISVEFATVAGPVTPSTLAGGVVGASVPISQVWVASPTDDTVTSLDAAGTIGPVVTGGPRENPEGIAVDPNGIAWICYRDSEVVRRVDAAGVEIFVFGSASDVVVTGTGSAPSAVAISSRGRAWIGNTGNNSVTVVNPFGRIIFGGDGALDTPDDGVFGPALLLDAPPTALAADAADSMWVTASDGASSGYLYRINRSGSIGAVVDYGSDDPVAVSVDRQGIAWVCLAGAGRVDRVASDGSIIQSFTVPDARSIAVRRRPFTSALREAWVVGDIAGAPGLYRLRPDASIDEFPGIGIGVSGITMDGRGRPWISRDTGTVQTIDPDAPPGTSPLFGSAVTIGTDARILGDTTAYTQAFVQFPDGNPLLRSFFDFDGDGYVNVIELNSGTDVFDALDEPSALVPLLPVQGLVCTQDGLDAQLSWGIPTDVDPVLPSIQGYTSIEVRVDGVLTATQPSPTDESFEFALPGAGTYLIEVTGVGATTSPPVECTLTVGPGALLDTQEVILDGDLLNPFDVSTGPATAPTVALGGPASDYALFVTDPQLQLLAGLAIDGSVAAATSTAIFTASGGGTGSFGATGCSYVAEPAGGGPPRVYVVGGSDTDQVQVRAFEINAATGDFELLALPHIFITESGVPRFGSPGGLAAQPSSGGVGDILLFGGPDGCELLACLSTSTGDIEPSASFSHPAGIATYGLQGVAFVDDYGPGGGQAWISSVGSSESSFSAIEVDVASGAAVDTGESISLAVLDEDNVLGGFDFAESPDDSAIVIEVVGITTSSISAIEASSFFVRGDANGSGDLDIADAVTTLGVLFQGVAPEVCDAALDANGDESVDVADAIYLLTFLFSAGPPPPPPYPDAGGEALECVGP